MDTEGSLPLPASSFQPPAFDEAPRYPGWVLLDSKAYFADHENATTAEATAITGRTVKVTFCLADPPAVSHFCVHGPGFNREDYAAEPRVLSSEKDLVLLGFVFTTSLRSTAGQDTLHAEYFVYRAGRGKPSLTPIPATPIGTGDTLSAGIVPQDDIDDEGGFLLADLVASTTLEVGHYELSVFSSRTATWTTQTLQLHALVGEIRLVDMFIMPHKVIALRRGMLGWVDLWRGIVACNILAEEPFIYFVPLPKPDFNLARKGDPKPVRDVACFNGVIKLVEIDHFFRRELVTINHNRRFKMTRDLDSVDMIHHSEILLRAHEDFLETSSDKITYIPDGWKIRTCYMHICSDVWCKGQNIHVDDILVNDPRHYMMLPQLWDDSARKFTLRNLTTVYPTFTIHGDDVIYLMSKVDYYDKNSLVVGVDLGKKTMEMLKPYSAERAYHFKPALFPCAFSKYLNTTPSVKKATDAQNGPLNYLHTQGHVDSAYPDYSYIHYQHPPPGQSNLSHGTHPGNDNLTFPNGCVHSMNTSQTEYPVPMVYTDTHGQPWLSVPLGSGTSPFASLMPLGSAPPPFAQPCNKGCDPRLEASKQQANERARRFDCHGKRKSSTR